VTEETWDPEIAALRERQRIARELGGAEKVRIQKSKGKLTVRERIDRLLDAESFREIGSIAGSADYGTKGELTHFLPSNFIFGRGRIHRRPMVVAGDDFTVRGGAADAAIHEKQVQAEQMAHELRLPLVRLIDGTGGGGSVKTLETGGVTYIPACPGWNWVVDNLGVVPVVSLGLGPVAGLGAARLVSSHYSVLVKGLGQMFAAGPALVGAAGRAVTKEELGGAELHARSGAVDDLAEDEEAAFSLARRFLSYLPSSVDGLADRVACNDDINRCDRWLDGIIPRDRRTTYKVRKILDSVFDRDSFFEMGRRWGGSIITGFARLDGWPVAAIASDVTVCAGAWTADAAQKLTRFVELAETFQLPVVNFVDIPGLMIGVEAEKAATLRHGGRALASVYQAKVPWCTIIIRKAFGVAGSGMANHTRVRYRYAWPSGDWGSLPIEGGIEVAYKAELDAAADREGLRQEITERLNRVRSPLRSAEKFLVEEIIAPHETRPLLCEFANLAAPLRRPGGARFTFRP
jgi:acetyl-CoA carboxylase carboxyltransferase component